MTRLRPLLAATLILLVSTTVAPPTPAQQKSGGDAGTDDVRPPAEQLLAESDDIAQRVADLRGLEVRESIDKGIREREELRKILVDKLADDQSAEQMRHEGAVLRQLGLIPRDMDYREMILDVLTEQIAGFYDQKTESLNIMRGIPLDLQRPAMAHEIYHAIQDQHFDLEALIGPFEGQENGDFELARQALIEGDATVLMVDYTLHRRGTLPMRDSSSIADLPFMSRILTQLDYADLGALEQFGRKTGLGSPQTSGDGGDGSAPSPARLAGSALGEAPPVIRRALIFPYLGGMKFVLDMRRGRSWDEFDRVYDYAPVSTEQILHPERYANRDEPVVLEHGVGDALGPHEQIYRTVFGEFQMRLFLDQHVGRQQDADVSVDVARAATGWDGDRLQAFRLKHRDDSGGPVVTHVSVWDTLRDAREYFDALDEMVGVRFPDARTTRADGKYGASLCARSPANEHRPAERIYVERWGDLVLHVEGLPARADEKQSDANGDDQNQTDDNDAPPVAPRELREAVWSSLERRPFREVLRERRESAAASEDEKTDDK